jgi:predicted ester cyclase
MIRAGLPDLRRVVHRQVAEGDLVVSHFTDRGTHQGPLMGLPPSGRTIAVDGINIARVQNGRITELWHVEDLMGLMRQLGAIPG